MKSIGSSLALVFFSLTLILLSQTGHAIEAIASVKHLQGDVEILRDSNTIAARTGLILHDKDLVVTHPKSRITIVFRDGSVIRLFPNTKFLIEKSQETADGPRRFLHNFKLRLGSFWGNFTKRQQETVIATPTATIGIKGTTVAMTERDNELAVNLSSGKAIVKNQTESVALKPGEYATKITQTGSIKARVEQMPFQITIIPDHKQIMVPGSGETKELFFTLQLVDMRSNKNVSREGNVYVSIAADNITFEQEIRLNTRGYARIRATIKPPEKAVDMLKYVEVFALMDGEEFLDTRAGSTLLTLNYPLEQKRKLSIDAGSGDIR